MKNRQKDKQEIIKTIPETYQRYVGAIHNISRKKKGGWVTNLYKFIGVVSINERDLKDTLDKIGFSILSFKKRGLSLFPGCSVKAIKFI